jgi:hypothetical protein
MPTPSNVKIIKSDASSWTVQIDDADGISHLDSNYGKMPYTYAWREMGKDCPTSQTFKILKQRKFFFRTLEFHNAEVVDCISETKPEYTITHFQIDKGDKLRFWKTHDRDKELQSVFDRLEMKSQSEQWWRYMTRPILVVLFLLLLFAYLLWKLSIWSGLGPLW